MKKILLFITILLMFSCGQRIFLEPEPDVVYKDGSQYLSSKDIVFDKAVLSGRGCIYEYFRCREYQGEIELRNIKESGNYEMFLVADNDTLYSRTVYLYENLKDDLTITAVDVSQGDCFVIGTPGKDPSVMDGGYGSLGEYYWQDGGSTTLLNYLKNTGQTSLDMIIETHHDRDHYGGLDDVVSSGEIGYEEYIDCSSETLPLPGDTLFFSDDLKAVMLHYGNVGGDPDTEENDRSVSFLMIYGDFEMVFTGDIEYPAEEQILLHGILDPSEDYEILKVPHHGSSSSSSDMFLENICPDRFLICSGQGNPWGHPEGEVLEKLDAYSPDIYRTDRFGNIEISTDGMIYSVSYLKNEISRNK